MPILLTSVLAATLMGEAVTFRNLTVGNALLLPLLMFAERYLESGGVNEESGWRGFVLPRLQARHSVLVASIIVWFFWGLWHLPLDIYQGIPIQQVLLNRLVLTSVRPFSLRG